MKNRNHLLLAVLVGVLCAAPASQVRAEDPQVARVEQGLLPDSPITGEPAWALSERMRRYNVPGVQIAVIQRGRLVWTRGYGVADPKTGRRVTAQTLFDAGSISKAVTAVAVIKLAEQGKFSLDAPINSLLRSWKLPENEFTRKSPVTLRRLLSHTAGTSVSGFWGYLPGEPLPTLLQILDGQPPAANGPVRVEAVPGTAWRYSGGGFVIIQQVIEDVTGKPFAEAMEEILFRPLGMRRSTFVQGLPPALRPDAATPTSEASYFKGRRLHPHAAAAGLYTTATDLAVLVEAFCSSQRGDSGAFLSPSSAHILITPIIRDREPWDRAQVNRRNTQKDQAAGFMLMSRNGRPGETVRAYFDGLNAGFRSRMMFDPYTGDGVVILYNSDGDEEFLSELTRAVASVYVWKDYLNDPIRPLHLSASELNRYIGRYRRTDDNVVTIRRERDHLLWTDLYTVPQPIYPVGGDAFEHRELFGRPSQFTLGSAGVAMNLDGWPRLPVNPVYPAEYLLRGEVLKGIVALRAETGITEERLGTIGFNLLETHRLPSAAAAVYRVSVERFPGSSGAWDALGDALKRAGDLAEGTAAEGRAEALRTFRNRLTADFEGNNPANGWQTYADLRAKFGSIPLGDLLDRLSRRLRDQGKMVAAEEATRLAASDHAHGADQ